MVCSAKWVPPPHAGIKERIVQGYLHIWFTRLSKWHSCLLYVDGFSGPGIYNNSMKGSPIIALDEATWALSRKGHEKAMIFLVFIEKDLHIADELKYNVDRYIKELRNRYDGSVIERLKIEMHNKDFSSVIENLEKHYNNIGKAPALVFLDPFGVIKSGFSFEWLKKVSQLGRTEVLFNFYVQGIERNRYQIVPERVEQIFGENVDISNMSVKEMVEFLRSKIKNELGMYVLLYEMRNRKNRTLYYLVFATKHPEGVKKNERSDERCQRA